MHGSVLCADRIDFSYGAMYCMLMPLSCKIKAVDERLIAKTMLCPALELADVVCLSLYAQTTLFFLASLQDPVQITNRHLLIRLKQKQIFAVRWFIYSNVLEKHNSSC